jgi:hypothetical protein
MEHERIGIGAQFRHDEGTRCAMSPDMKATSRESRSSLATMIGHLRLRAAASAAASCRRRSSASEPLPLSASTKAAVSSNRSCAAKRMTASF